MNTRSRKLLALAKKNLETELEMCTKYQSGGTNLRAAKSKINILENVCLKSGSFEKAQKNIRCGRFDVPYYESSRTSNKDEIHSYLTTLRNYVCLGQKIPTDNVIDSKEINYPCPKENTNFTSVTDQLHDDLRIPDITVIDSSRPIAAHDMESDSGSLQLNSSDSSVEVKIQKNITWSNNHPAMKSDIEFSTTANSTQIISCSEENMPTLSAVKSSNPSIRNNVSEDCNLKTLSRIDYSSQLGLSDTSEEDPFAASDDGDSDYILSSNTDSSIELTNEYENDTILPNTCGKKFSRNCKSKKIECRVLNEVELTEKRLDDIDISDQENIDFTSLSASKNI